MTLDEYIAQAKVELDHMRDHWLQEHAKTPDDWPLELEEEEWEEQERAERYGLGG